MYASATPLAYLLLLPTVGLPSVFVWTVIMFVNIKSSLNLLEFLNGDYLLGLLMKVNKIDLNLIFLFYFYIYSTYAYKHKSILQLYVFLLGIILHLVPLINDAYLLTNTKFLYLIVNDLSLSNGAVIIHPILILINYSLILTSTTLAFCTNKHYLPDCMPLKLFKNLMSFKQFNFVNMRLIIVAVFLGAYWAHQELNWGGYWSWDLVELISLSLMSILVLLSHLVKLRFSVTSSLLVLTVVMLLFTLVRLGVVQSVHGFLPSQFNDLSFQNFLAILPVMLMVTLVYITYYKVIFIKKNIPLYYLSSKLSLMSYILCLFVAYPLLMVLVTVLYGEVESSKHGVLLLLGVVMWTMLLVSKLSLINLMLPLQEGVIISLYLKFRAYNFFFKFYHFLILLLLYYFFYISHNYSLSDIGDMVLVNTKPFVKVSNLNLVYSLSLGSMLGDVNNLTTQSLDLNYSYTAVSKSDSSFIELIVTQVYTTLFYDNFFIIDVFNFKSGWTTPLIIASIVLCIVLWFFNVKRKVRVYY